MSFGVFLPLGSNLLPILEGSVWGTSSSLDNLANNEYINEALANLPSAGGFGQVLYFGFGYKSYVQILAETRSGVNFIALCSCLSKVHSQSVTARILSGLWKELKFRSNTNQDLANLSALYELPQRW